METQRSVFDGIKTGILDCIDYERGNKSKARKIVYKVKPVPTYDAESIKRIRTRRNLTQYLFGSVIGVSVRTVEAWEQGKNVPNRSASRVIDMIDKDPDFVKDIVQIESFQ